MAEKPQNPPKPPKMSPQLPFETITEILSRLPVKPLHRFKCVSKPWQTLISSPKFIKLHLTQTLTTTPDPNIVLISRHSLISSPISATKFRFSELKHPLRHIFPVGLIASYNGILFISDHPQQILVLYNPTINSYRFLPTPPSPPATIPDGAVGYNDQFFGFGYDSLNDDYKVVRLLQWLRLSDGAELYSQAAVYSMRDNVWKLVKDETKHHFLQHGHAETANEMLHFGAVSADCEKKTAFKCFDLRTETLLIVDYPELETLDKGKYSTSCTEVRGCLCMLVNYHKPSGDSNVGNFGVRVKAPLDNPRFLYADVWEMRERGRKESWVKLFRIPQWQIVERDISKCHLYLRLLTYSKDRKSVLLEVDGRGFGWYDLVKKRIKRVKVQGMRFEDSRTVALTFAESLVSVNNDKVVSKGRTMPPRKNIKNKEVDFLSSGFKLKL